MRYSRSERKATTVSDALLAVGFEAPPSTSRVTFTILVNNQEVDFTAPVKNGDTLDVIIKPIEDKTANAAAGSEQAPGATAQTTVPGLASAIASAHLPK